ncbi:molybdopterin synthase catalytic subunit MoaE [Kistimonas scapharcae]|uniref:Molybdopterin synthase catalytic subunit n=1 Tax=Kistimonas scapharcae TaxID=1036133 RepID=A0ABP8V2V9_9GAMM
MLDYQRHIAVQTDDFDLAHEYQCLRSHSATGAIVTFCGLVRDMNDGKDVTGLFLEHYPGMTEKTLDSIADEAAKRWPLQAVRVIHRVGQMALCDQIVFVGVASAHRGAAFDACEFIMDFLKSRAPFWKREQTTQGEHWVEARTSDQDALERWT